MNKLASTTLGSFYFTATPSVLAEYGSRKPLAAKPVIVVDIVNNTSTQYPSITAASKAIKIHHDFIIKHLDRSIFMSMDRTRQYRFLTGHILNPYLMLTIH
jgi:hypothetical protein